MINIINVEYINVDSPMGILLSYLYLFITGSFLGWILEVFFRRFFSMHRWTNPGFLRGPCLPLYGFGLCLLYLICTLCFKYLCNGVGVPDFYFINKDFDYLGQLNFGYTSLIVILAIGVGMTVLELLAGLIFVKGFNIKLWDYSTLKGNYKGIICPLFSCLWLIAGALYWFFVHPYVINLVGFFNTHAWGITFVLGIYLGLLVVDIANSIKLASKLSGVAKKNKFVLDFSKFQLNAHLDRYKRRDRDKTWFEEQAELAASKIKNKVGELTYDIKRHMYVGNVIPTKGAAETDETPRTKAKQLKNSKSVDNVDKTIEIKDNPSKVNKGKNKSNKEE